MGRLTRTGWGIVVSAIAVMAALAVAGPPTGAAPSTRVAPRAHCGRRAALDNDAASARRALSRLTRGTPDRRTALPVLGAVRGGWRGRRPSDAARRALTGAEAQAICLLRGGEAASVLRLSRIAAVHALSARELAYMDALWALQAHRAGGQSIAVAVARQAELCFRTSSALLRRRPAPGGGACVFATPGFSPARAATDDRGCARGADLPVPVARGVPGSARGKVLPGTGVRSQVVHFPPRPYVPGPNALIDHYPDGRLPVGPPEWRNLGAVPPSKVVRATSANAIFNAQGSRYRIAFDFSHYGEAPVNIGDLSANGADDLAISDHYSYVDGIQHAGEVDVYYGHRGRGIDPRSQAPDIILYGDQDRAKFGISIAPAGDVNGDGWPDLLIGAAFHTTDHGRIANGGTAYLVYGGFLQQFRCTVKIRAQDIGRTIPGIRFEGGYDRHLYLAWSNELDSGDFTGDGLSDLLIGAYDPYNPPPGTLGARAYLIYGSRRLPLFYAHYRLGIDRDAGGIQSLIFQDPDPAATNASLAFSASFVGDITGSGRDALAFTAAGAGPTGGGQAYIFTRRLDPSTAPPIDMTSADVTVTADRLDQGGVHLRFMGLASARPAGDVNGDGIPDVIFTARNTESWLGGRWTHVGAAAVLYGRRGGLPAQIPLSSLDHIYYGDEPGQLGQPASDHGADFNGDGRADVLLADPYYLEPIGGQLQQRGRMWLVLSSPSQPRLVDVVAAASRYIVADTTLPGLFGFTWDTGDFNGDGRPDLVISDHYEGDRSLDIHAGVVYLFYNARLKLTP